MKILILAGDNSISTDTHPALVNDKGIYQLDQRIQSAEALGLEISVVLSGESSDQVLRNCRRVATCDLVFDTNYDDATFFSNLKAGLYTVNKDALVINVSTTVPTKAFTQSLQRENLRWGIDRGCHIIHPAVENAPLGLVNTPFLVSRAGKNFIKNSDGLISLADPRIKYLTVRDDNFSKILQPYDLPQGPKAL